MNKLNILNYISPYNWKRPAGVLKNLKYMPHGFKWAYQRITRGYADCDVWSLDQYIAQIIVDGLRDLAKYSISYPYGMTPDEWQQWLIDTAAMFEKAYIIDWYELELSEEEESLRAAEREKLRNIAFDRLKERFLDLWD